MTDLDLTTIALAVACGIAMLIISALIMADGARILPPLPRLPRPRLPRRRRPRQGRHSAGTWRPARPGDTPGELTPEHGPTHPVDAPAGPERRTLAPDRRGHVELPDVPELPVDPPLVRRYVLARDLVTGVGR